MTFDQQMSIAAELVTKHPRVGEEQRQRFRVVMLDEYQDTGQAQRVLLRSLFGEGKDPGLAVTAVGDPMQSIYMFRGATASNLEKFRADFAPAEKLELTTSWRNPSLVLNLANVVSRWYGRPAVGVCTEPTRGIRRRHGAWLSMTIKPRNSVACRACGGTLGNLGEI